MKKAEVIREKLTASTWRELETNGKFDKNAKLSFISDDMLILGCDVVSKNQIQTRAVACSGSLRRVMTLLESLAGTQCMNRWDEGSWYMIQ